MEQVWNSIRNTNIPVYNSIYLMATQIELIGELNDIRNSTKIGERPRPEISLEECDGIRSIVDKLKQAIDIFSLNSKNTKDLVLESARELDERGLCNREDISRKLKQLLSDKIAEGKISGRWIEECLPKEYKRPYRKSEVGSLSKQASCNDCFESHIQNNGTVLVSKDGDVHEVPERNFTGPKSAFSMGDDKGSNGLEEGKRNGSYDSVSGCDANDDQLFTMLVQASDTKHVCDTLEQSKQMRLIWLSSDQIFIHLKNGSST